MLLDNGIVHDYDRRDHINIGAPMTSGVAEVIPARPHRPVIVTIGYFCGLDYQRYKDKIVISDIDTPDDNWATRYDLADPDLLKKILKKVTTIIAQSDNVERARWIQKSSGKYIFSYSI